MLSLAPKQTKVKYQEGTFIRFLKDILIGCIDGLYIGLALLK